MANKILKIMSMTLIAIFIVSNFSLSVSFAAVNSGYNETGMSPTTPTSPSQSPSSPNSPMSPSTSPSESPPTQPTPSTPTTSASPTEKIDQKELAVLYLQFQLQKVKAQRKLLDELDNAYMKKHTFTRAEIEMGMRIQNENEEAMNTEKVLEKLLLDLVPPTP